MATPLAKGRRTFRVQLCREEGKSYLQYCGTPPDVDDRAVSAAQPDTATAADQIGEDRRLDGVAGARNTITLSVIREGAEANEYKAEGFAPTNRAAQQLGGAGMETSTLQAHLARDRQAGTGEKRLYVLDESSFASTKQMHNFVSGVHPTDRVLLVGDTRQHETVEAGRPFPQL